MGTNEFLCLLVFVFSDFRLYDGSFSLRRMECPRPTEDHEKYVQYETFEEMNYLDKLPNELAESDFHDLHSFLKCMYDLTGLLLLKNKNYKKKYTGTGFISKTRRQYGKQCPCPLEHQGNEGFYAIVTISTAYHIFNDNEDNTIKSFEECDEIWKDFDTEFKLDYNDESDIKNSDVASQDIASDDHVNDSDGHSIVSDGPGDDNDEYSSDSNGRANVNDSHSSESDANSSVNRDQSGDDGDRSTNGSSDGIELEKLEALPTLYGHQLLESDKELDFKSDWCAVECVTHNETLINRLEATLQKYQALMTKLYKISQSSDMYKSFNLVVIIGHPHAWPKRISIGQTQALDSVPDRAILKEIRSQQTWCRYSYNNVTCDGSSGSPVFIWGQPITGFGYWFGHPHNHAKINWEKRYGLSTIGVEHFH